MLDQVDKFHRFRTTSLELGPIEASETEEFSDEDAVEAKQRNIDAAVNDLDLNAGGVFVAGGQLNAERRL